MDSKKPYPEPVANSLPPPSCCSGRRRLRYLLLPFLFLMALAWARWPAHQIHLQEYLQVSTQAPVVATTTGVVPAAEKKVQVEAHIMSKCPDARDCLRDLVIPAMESISTKVNFTLSFIGKTTDHDDGVACMHGQSECLGNIIELCTANLYPDPKIYLGFTMCLFKSYSNIPKQELVEDCALEHGVDFSKVNECMSKDDGAFGMGMLRSSVERSAAANVTKSCTVRVQENIWCIRDGGEWKECDGGSSPKDLVKEVEKLYKDKE
ncbi:hypothetical protein K402DRAFT_389788 [Aulographum hederae CBS 113979]|uniref:Gamma interferon inducible lysosomal thiol reductase n=1 Tax=Aulographum hederae CBS 113979 TaxID=1176131 RepID=A0A6G1HCD5_9PEZI|nr:hypothetical protein K402DRAFT_389788 [Aulographum hederae CBS 113979]